MRPPHDADLFPQTLPPRAEQLALALPIVDRMRAEDFLVAPCNRLAHAAVLAWPAADPVLVLTGPRGSGKTPLARIAAERTRAVFLADAGADAGMDPQWLDASAWIVDDADRWADETLLFHLVNLARADRRGLLVTTTFPVAVWRPRLADLRSRLLAAPTVAIAPVDDALLAAMLVKQFGDRQLRIAPALVHYLVARMERSFAAARRVVAMLDQAALVSGRPITPSLARLALGWLDTGTNEPDGED